MHNKISFISNSKTKKLSFDSEFTKKKNLSYFSIVILWVGGINRETTFKNNI